MRAGAAAVGTYPTPRGAVRQPSCAHSPCGFELRRLATMGRTWDRLFLNDETRVIDLSFSQQAMWERP